MSQPLSSTTDSQALLQSMLQRLRLQPGSEGLARPPLHSPTSASQDWELNGTSSALHTQPGVMVGTTTTALEPPRTYDIISEPVMDNSNPDNRIHYGSPKGKLDSMDEFGTSASDYTFQQRTVGRDGKEHSHYVLPKQQQDIATYSFTYHSLPSSSSPGGNIMAAGDRELGQAELSQATPTGTQTGQDLPAGHSHGIRHVSDRETDVISCQIEEREGNDRDCSALNGKLDQVFLGGPATHQHTEPLQHSPLYIRKPQNETRDRPGLPDVVGPYPTALSLPAASPLTSLTSNQGCQMSKVVVESPKMERNQSHDSPSTPIAQGFTPKVWTWSLKSVDSGVSPGRDVEKSLPLDIVQLQVSDQSQGVDIFSVSESTPRSKKEKRLSDSTKRKWTQRIKDRWRDRRGGLGKRGKEPTGVDEEKKKEGDFPSQNQTTAGDHGALMSNVEEGKAIQSACATAHDDAPGLVTEVCDMTETVRSNSEVDFGLGSFSLLEEILTGQKWARFLNPTQADISTNIRPVVEAENQPTTPVGRKDQGNALSGLNQTPTRNNEWGFRLNEVNSVSERRITQMPSDNSVPTSRDIPESNLIKVQEARSNLIQPEPMEHGQDQTDEVEPTRFLQSDFSFIKPADVLDILALKSGIHLNRKRGHQPQESNTEGEREQGELLDSGEAMKDLTTTQSKERDNSNLMMSLHPLKSSPSAHISARPPTLVPRGVLKHSISQDSQCSSSLETRRLEDSRRVRFSEDVVSIEPHVLLTDSEVESEEDSSVEDDTFLYEDVKMEQVEEVVPARRHSRPSWMLALKKKHLGKKPL